MKFNLKDYLKLSLLYTFAASFPALLQIFILPIIEGEGRLGAVDFSQMAISESISTFVGTFILFSMTSAISRFYYDYIENKKGIATMFSSILLGIIFRGLIVFGVAIILGDYVASFFTQPELHNFSTYGYGAIGIGINRAIIIAATTLYRNQKIVSRFIIINILTALLRSTGQLIGIFCFDMSFAGYVNGAAIGGGVVTVAVIIFTFAQSGIHYSRATMKPIVRFVLPLFIFEVVKWGVLFADRFFMESTPEQLGIYDNAQRFAAGIYIIFQGLYGAVQPDFFHYLQIGIKESISDLRRLANIYMLQAQIAALGLIIPVIIYIHFFFETSLTTSATLIAIIFAQYIITAVNTIFSLPIIYNKRTDIFLVINLFVLAISLTLNYLLIPKFGYYGAIFASYTANLTQLALLVFFQNQIIKIKWNYKKSVATPLLIVIFAILTEVLKNIFDLNYLLMSFVFIGLSGFIILLQYKKEATHFIFKYLKVKG
ncbi:MAG: polysaccharide biosynthesis C-terminal domain-containing protein [Salinivirgaceae bacterium]|nr:polysaccharide biosynthesis C-terminal domain-containing protein [Salinivirgaceae bacterium]MDY0279749.1 polysaccharide biosynthesis C-terminal domain-containing protein [Salinivirgaceae bacterium]